MKKLERTNNYKAAGGNPLITQLHQGISSNPWRLACSHGTWACEQRTPGKRENRCNMVMSRTGPYLRFSEFGFILEAGAPLGTSSPLGLGQVAWPSGNPNLSPHHLLGVWGGWLLERRPSSFRDAPWCSHPSHGHTPSAWKGLPPGPLQVSNAGHPATAAFPEPEPWAGLAVGWGVRGTAAPTPRPEPRSQAPAAGGAAGAGSAREAGGHAPFGVRLPPPPRTWGPGPCGRHASWTTTHGPPRPRPRDLRGLLRPPPPSLSSAPFLSPIPHSAASPLPALLLPLPSSPPLPSPPRARPLSPPSSLPASLRRGCARRAEGGGPRRRPLPSPGSWKLRTSAPRPVPARPDPDLQTPSQRQPSGLRARTWASREALKANEAFRTHGPFLWAGK